MRRRSGAVFALVAILLGPQLSIAPARALEEPTATLDVSWTRPGVGGVLHPPAALRVGDTVSIGAAVSEMTFYTCSFNVLLQGTEHDVFGGPSLWARSSPADDSPDGCTTWTFVIAPFEPGRQLIASLAVNGLGPPEGTVARDQLTVLLEPGGAPIAFESNYPNISWAASDLLDGQTPTFGEPVTFAAPVGATDCMFAISGSQSGFDTRADSATSCDPWTLTLPEQRPAWARDDHPFGGPWQASVGFMATTTEPETGRTLFGQSNSEPLAFGTGPVGGLDSTHPLAVFPEPQAPRYAHPGPYSTRAALAGVESGTCRYERIEPDHTDVRGQDEAIVDGECPGYSFEADQLGLYQYYVYVRDVEGNDLSAASGSVSVDPPLPEPEVEVPEAPIVDVPVVIEAGVADGAPVSYEVGVVPADAGSRSTATSLQAGSVAAVTCTGAAGAIDPDAHGASVKTTCKLPKPGQYTVAATFTDAAGATRMTTRVVTAVADAVAPTTSAVSQGLTTGSIVSGKVPLKVTWTGHDATSGIATYTLRQQTDGGSWTTVSSSLTGTALIRSLTPGHTYRFAVRAVDKAGNVGPYAYGNTVRVSGYQEGSSSIRYGGTWTTSSSSTYWAGRARHSSAAGAKATFTFAGRKVAWVSAKGPTRGKAKLYVNGTYLTTLDLYASATQGGRVVWTKSWASSAKRTLTVRVSGTSGRPRVSVDGFVILN